MKLERHTMVLDLSSIISAHVEGYNKRHGEIIHREWYIDTVKDKVVVILTTETPETKE